MGSVLRTRRLHTPAWEKEERKTILPDPVLPRPKAGGSPALSINLLLLGLPLKLLRATFERRDQDEGTPLLPTLHLPPPCAMFESDPDSLTGHALASQAVSTALLGTAQLLPPRVSPKLTLFCWLQVP